MSIDDRLRGAFTAPSEQWNVNRSLEEVMAASERTRVGRKVVLACALAAAIAIVAGYGVGVGRDRAGQPIAPPSETVTTSPGIPQPLEGVWQTAPLTRADLRATLRAAGFGEHFPAMLDDLPQLPVRFTLGVAGRNLSLRATGGSTSEVFDEETILTIVDQRLTIMPSAGGTNTYRWSIDGSGLHLVFLETTERVAYGVPPEAWQRLLYTSAPFAAR